MNKINRFIVWILLFVGGVLPIAAQSSGDGYNPDNPAQPGNIDQIGKHNVTLALGTEGAGTVSGSGRYDYGSSVTIKATAVTGYNFAYWLKNDETTACSTSASYTFTVTEDVKFTAVYLRVKQVYAYVSDAAAGKATVTRQVVGGQNQAVLTATASTADYHFLYWLKNDDTEACSTDNPFTYDIQDDDWLVKFTAVYEFIYNPANPEEPAGVDTSVKYKVNVTINDTNAGVVSGGGRYTNGTEVTISTSNNAGYEFRQWLLDGQPYSTEKSFKYTVGTADVAFKAEYVNTAEELEQNGHALYLTTNQSGSCTFSIASGTKYLPGATYSVTVIPGQEQTFDGWYIGSTLVGTSLTYSDTMGDSDVTLSAHFIYTPDNPDDPSNPGGYVETVYNYGDLNEDKVVDITDIVLLVDYLRNTPDTTAINLNNADANKDGSITADDIDAVKALVLEGKKY